MTSMPSAAWGAGSVALEDGAMTKTIVVPLDGSKRSQSALPVAAWLGRRLGADIRLVTTTYSSHPSAARAFLDRSEQLLPAPQVTSKVIKLTSPAYGILEEAEDAPDALLVMSTRGRSGTGRMLLGSVSDEILGQTMLPVVLVGPGCRPHNTTASELLVAIDDEVAMAAVTSTAARWATDLDLVPRVVTVVDPADLPTDVDSLVAADCVRSLEESGFETRFSVVQNSSPAEGVLDLASSFNPALVVMPTHSRGGFRARALGHVTAGVVRSSPVPVLVHRVFDASWAR
jgi:nucleotide-binding universal stress UspA family protein